MNRIIKKMTVVFLSLAITLLAFPAGILTAYKRMQQSLQSMK